MTKVQENRLRRMAARRGYLISKSRRRDPRALDYGTWQITPAGRPWRRGDISEAATGEALEAFLEGAGR